MIVKVLGSSAGGAFPQWNCACPNCAGVRRGSIAARSRTQSQLAVSSDGHSWHLLNASPDIRFQIEGHVGLQPDPERGTRHSPIQSVTLTNADLDHALGLLLLRESQPLAIYSTPSVQKILLEDNSFFGMLRQSQTQTQWRAIDPGTRFELLGPAGQKSGIHCTPVTVSGRYPRYVQPERVATLRSQDAVVGLVLEGAQDRRLGYFPGVAQVTPELLEIFGSCEALLVDGTFWTEDEMRRVHGQGKLAAEMGHIPLSGPDGLIDRLKGLTRTRRIFVHINNTNPILDEASEACRQTREAGWEIAQDGLELKL